MESPAGPTLLGVDIMVVGSILAAVAAMAPAGPAAAAAAAAVATVNAADTAWILVSTGTSSHRDVRTVGLVRRKPLGHPFGFVSFPRRLNPRYLSLRRTPNDR